MKITLDPEGVQYSRYLVKINLNSRNNDKIRILSNISSSMNGTENGAILLGEILNPPKTPFELYYVFRFEKIDPKTPLADHEKTFINKAVITPIKADGTAAESLNPELELKIRDAHVNLM